MKKGMSVIILGFAFLYNGTFAGDYPIGVKFKYDTVTRKGVRGDNWCQTWASDGNIYTMMDDGNGWWPGPESGSLCIQITRNTHSD